MGKTTKSPTADSSIDNAPVAGQKKIDVRYLMFALLALAVPLIVSVVVIAQRRWYPANLDFAWTEFRVRDVGTSRSPLVGLPGRIGALQREGSHLGPMSFYLLAPLYRILGSNTWALRTSGVGLNFAGLAVVLLIARRRGGALMTARSRDAVLIFLGIFAAAALLVHFLGASVLTDPWNPYMPAIWWMVFLLAVWSVLLDDLPMLPVVVFSGAFCIQTHISYLGLVGGMGALVLGWIAFSAFRRKGALGARPWLWVGLSVALLVALFSPVITDQLTNKPGNLSIIWDYFTEPPEVTIGFGSAIEILLAHLNPLRLIAGESAATGPIIPGLIVLGLWASSFFAAIKRGIRELVALDAVLLLAIVLGLISTARIFGYVWFYLLLWAWVLLTLMLFATCWGLIVIFAERTPRGNARVERALAGVLIMATLVLLASASFNALSVRDSTESASETLGELVQSTTRALNSGDVIGGGKSGHYLVDQAYAFDFYGTVGGFVDELERAGFKAGYTTGAETQMTPKRTTQRGLASAVLQIAVGPDIQTWRDTPGAVEIAFAGLDDAGERSTYQRLARDLIKQVPPDQLSGALANAYSSESELSDAAKRTIFKLQRIRLPHAVFIMEPSVGLTGNEAALSAYPLSVSQYRRAAERVPGTKSHVLVVGDADAWSFAFKSRMPFRGANSWIMTSARRECPIVGGNFATDSIVFEPTEDTKQCGEWQRGLGDAVSGFKPDDIVLVASGSETYDREIGGEFFRLGTPEYARLIKRSLRIAMDYASRSNATLTIVGIPCADPSATVVPQLAELRKDPARIGWANSVLESFAKAQGRRVRFIKMDGLVCPGGAVSATPEGLAIRPDGENYSPAGVEAVLNWIDSKIQSPN
ncbi:MAG: hypothetical protein F2723_02895 [Actinobacteria bacterium]|uniref:Unannotated protein n=1 Tax=freshwater metagenome TaxID=449393 RepID=A0A6J6VZ09_9ZZZZ|nr:hypothetical protein [Actinomycetota bacterium]